jgi:hypothetical protein
MSAWVLSGSPEGYTREQALADRKEWLDPQRLLELVNDFDGTEVRLLLEAMKRGQSDVVHF